jgi:hypothetical protein
MRNLKLINLKPQIGVSNFLHNSIPLFNVASERVKHENNHSWNLSLQTRQEKRQMIIFNYYSVVSYESYVKTAKLTRYIASIFSKRMQLR